MILLTILYFIVTIIGIITINQKEKYREDLRKSRLKNEFLLKFIEIHELEIPKFYLED